jgi:hypothetical protein
MGKSWGQSGYDWRADFLGTDTITQADLNILLANYGMVSGYL